MPLETDNIEVNNSSEIKENVEQDNILTNDNQFQQETKTEEIQNEDKEIENLKQLCPYTSEQCYQKSIDASLEFIGDSNFQVMTCESMAYKGQLIGYCLKVNYKDNTWRYY